MALVRFPVSVVMQRTPLANRWIAERWEPVAVEPAACFAPDAAPAAGADAAPGAASSTSPGAPDPAPQRISDDATGTRWLFGGFAIELHRSEAEGYYLNVAAPEPKVFVMWRRADEGRVPPVKPMLVTVSYNEAARLLDGGEQVDAVPMLPELLAWMTPFVAQHYRPEPRRRLRRSDPYADAAPRGGRERPR